MMGIPLALEEVVAERRAPCKKAWQTIATPQLQVIAHCMGFEVTPHGDSSLLRVFIDYSLTATAPGLRSTSRQKIRAR